MKKTFIALFASLFCLSVFAQREADWTIDLKGSSQDIVFHNATGTPIVVTTEEYVGIDAEKKTSKWTVKRSGMAKLSGVTDMESDYYEIPVSELAIINNNVVKVTDGTILLDKEKENVSNIVNYHFLPDSRQLLIEAVSSGENVLFAINLSSKKIDWKTTIGSAGLGEKLNVSTEGAPAYPVETFVPVITKGGQLLFRNGKELVILDGKSGDLLWKEKCKPADYVLDDNTNTIFVIEKGGGLVASALAGADALGSVVYAYNMKDGKSPWKKELKLDGNVRYLEIWEDKLLVVHQEGMNFYNISDGKSPWKGDFKEKRISQVTETGEGLEVIFKGARIQMVDPASGKKLWKKHQIMEFDSGDEEVSEDMEIDKSNKLDFDGFTLYPSSQGTFTWIYYKNSKKYRHFYSTNIAIDDANGQLAALKNKSVLIVNTKDYKVKKKKVKLGNKNDLTTIKVVPNSGYFIYGANDYAMVSFDGTVKKEKAFKIPGEAGRRLLNTAAGLGTATAGVVAIAGTGKAGVGALGDTFIGDPKYGQMMNSGIKTMNSAGYAHDVLDEVYIARFNGFKEDESTAFFFSKNDDGDKVLYKVSKLTGDIVDEMKFQDNSPTYKIDQLSNTVYYAHKNKFYAFE